MAALETYDTTGEAEDVLDTIFNVSPVDTPVMSMSGDAPASARLVEALEDALRSAAANAAVEGAAASFSTPTAPVVLTNHIQIFDETAEVSGTMEAIRLYGRDGAMAYELARKYEELANDMEFAIVGSGRQAGTAGAKGTARQMTCLQAQLASAVTVDAATFASSSAITTIAQLEQCVLEAHKATDTLGGNPGYLVVPQEHALSVAGFANVAGRSRDINNERVIVNTIDLYVSPFGELDVIKDRNLDPDSMLLLDPAYAQNRVLRATTDYEIAKVGDADRRQIISERSFLVTNTRAHAQVDNIPAASALS